MGDRRRARPLQGNPRRADECPTVCVVVCARDWRRVPVKNLLRTAIGIFVAGWAVAGCSSDDSGPRYVERVPVAAPDSPASRVEYERPRPMPEPAAPAPALR